MISLSVPGDIPVFYLIMAAERMRNRAAEEPFEDNDQNESNAADPFLSDQSWIRAQFELVHREIVNVKSENVWLWEILKSMRLQQEQDARALNEGSCAIAADVLKLRTDIQVLQAENATLQWQLSELRKKLERHMESLDGDQKK